MLALKHLQMTDHNLQRRCLLDLPDELLDLIVDAIYADGGRFVRELIPISLTCHRLHRATAPKLFQTLHVRITNRYVDRRTFNILLNLYLFPAEFARHVRHLKQNDSFCFRENGCEALNLSNELVRQVVKQGLQFLCNVRTIRYDRLNSGGNNKLILRRIVLGVSTVLYYT